MNKLVEEIRTRVLRTIRARIRRDLQGASYPVARFLQALAQRPFEASLTIKDVRKAAGIRDHNFSARFCAEIGVRPYDYRQGLQVDAGDEMIDAGLPVPTAVLLAAVGLPTYVLARGTFRKLKRPLRIYTHPGMPIRLDPYNYSLYRRGRLSAERAQALLSILEEIELSEAVEPESSSEDVVERAVAVARAQIRRDQLLVPAGLDKVLSHVAENLTSVRLNANAAIRAADSKDRSLSDQLKFYLGSTVKVYVDQARAALMAHVFHETDLPVPAVGEIAGLTCYDTTVSTFKRCTGERPTDVREPSVKPGLPIDTWLCAALGEFDAVREVIAALRPLVPEAPAEPVMAVEKFERWYVETEVWPSLEKLPLEEARREVRRPAVSGMALVELLREKAREEGRRDRQRGIELAKLALDALLGVPLLDGDALKEETAMGWAWLGNQQRLALDFTAAEEAFGKAFEELGRREIDGPSAIVGDILDMKAALRIYQRQHEEAIELADLSLKNFRATGDRPGEIRALERRAVANDYAGMAEKALIDLTRILALDSSADIATFRRHYSMAIALVKIGKYSRAEVALQTAKRISEGGQNWPYHISWLEASIHHGARRFDLAEVGYCQAAEGFSSQGDAFSLAFISLDLAILYLDTDHHVEAINTLRSVVTFFNSLDLAEDALVAFRALNAALKKLQLTRGLLINFRDIAYSDPVLSVQSRWGQRNQGGAAATKPRSRRLGSGWQADRRPGPADESRGS